MTMREAIDIFEDVLWNLESVEGDPKTIKALTKIYKYLLINRVDKND